MPCLDSQCLGEMDCINEPGVRAPSVGSVPMEMRSWYEQSSRGTSNAQAQDRATVASILSLPSNGIQKDPFPRLMDLSLGSKSSVAQLSVSAST